MIKQILPTPQRASASQDRPDGPTRYQSRPASFRHALWSIIFFLLFFPPLHRLFPSIGFSFLKFRKMMNLIATARQPNSMIPSRNCCCVSVPRFSEKAMLQVTSSIGASIVVAVTTTPLEIVKTRLQIEPNNEKRLPSTHFSRSWNGLWNINFSSSTRRSTPLHIVKMILKNEGVSGLWTGTGAAIVHAVPSVSIYLVCYEQLKAKFEDAQIPNPLSPVLAGALARFVSVLITVIKLKICSL